MFIWLPEVLGILGEKVETNGAANSLASDGRRHEGHCEGVGRVSIEKCIHEN